MPQQDIVKRPVFISFNFVSPYSAYSGNFKLPKLELLTLMEITRLKSQYHFQQKLVGTLSLHQFIDLMRKINQHYIYSQRQDLLAIAIFLLFITNSMKLHYTGLKMVNHSKNIGIYCSKVRWRHVINLHMQFYFENKLLSSVQLLKIQTQMETKNGL